MKTRCFDALVDFAPGDKPQPHRVFLSLKTKKVPAFLDFYKKYERKEDNEFFIRVYPSLPLALKWKDKFEVEEKGRGGILGKGVVLNPFSSKIMGKKIKKRMKFLQLLQGGKRDVILALLQEKGIQGLGEREIINFINISKISLRHNCQELEEEGKIRILSFSPLFILSQQSLNFLSKKIVTYLEQFHKKHPEEIGVTQEKIKKRYRLHRRILSLSLRHLEKQGLIKELGNFIALSTFQMIPTKQEENVLRELEEMCFKGEFRSIPLREIQHRFHLSSKRLDILLSFLVEREKIVQGKDGFFLHSHWLNEIISKLKKFDKKEFTVSDFKRITRLSRRYAIPLLELLDQMGVTRRKSPSRREIL